MARDHGASDLTHSRSLIIAIAITATVFVLEVVGAIVSGSLALLADAGRMLSDLTALVIALVALAIAGRPASDRRTYGARRAEVFAATVNGLILIAVVIAGIAILTTGFVQADGIASLAVAALIVPRALSLLREALSVLGESVPRGTDVALIRDHVLGTRGVVGAHDVHVWSISPGSNVFSAQVVVEPSVFSGGGAGLLLDELGACLADHFDVEHSTFQLEPAEHAAHEEHRHR